MKITMFALAMIGSLLLAQVSIPVSVASCALTLFFSHIAITREYRKELVDDWLAGYNVYLRCSWNKIDSPRLQVLDWGWTSGSPITMRVQCDGLNNQHEHGLVCSPKDRTNREFVVEGVQLTLVDDGFAIISVDATEIAVQLYRATHNTMEHSHESL